MHVMESPNTVLILKSLADEMRLSIVRHLAEIDQEVAGNKIVTDCSNALKLSQPAMSHHFNKLVTAKVLLERKSGVEKYYSLNKPVLAHIGIDPNKL